MRHALAIATITAALLAIGGAATDSASACVYNTGASEPSETTSTSPPSAPRDAPGGGTPGPPPLPTDYPSQCPDERFGRWYAGMRDWLDDWVGWAQGDTDGDGIADEEDRCPDEWGPTNTAGCPDYDRDGIADQDDDCWTQPGPANTKGCPDGDGDGVADRDDSCPTEAGPPTASGCPDRDGDGRADRFDACPDHQGTQSNGCPDAPDESTTDAADSPGTYDNSSEDPWYDAPDDETTANYAASGYSASMTVSCPGDSYVVAHHFDGSKPLAEVPGSPAPEAAIARYLGATALLPPIPAAVFRQDFADATHAVFTASVNGGRRAAIGLHRTTNGWIATEFSACQSFVNSYLLPAAANR